MMLWNYLKERIQCNVWEYERDAETGTKYESSNG